MKVLKILSDGGDFGYLEFEQNFGGEKVSSLIERIENGEDLSLADIYTVELLEFEYIDPLFVAFLKTRIIDEDDQKHNSFLLETETV